MSKFREKFIGDKKFYSMVLAIALPILIQNGITTFVNMLDNIMVGRIGTEQMSGVSIVNQLIFIYNLSIFGGFSGAGIFTAQYNGNNDLEGIRNTFRFKLILGVVLTIVAFVILGNFGPVLIGLFLNGDNSGGDLTATLDFAMDYMNVAIWGLIPFMLLQVYSSTLRECGETVVPMRASISAFLINLVFNYLLIFGKFGFPCMGVKGAALATVMSRIVEVLIVAFYAHTKKEKFQFINTLYRTLVIPKQITKKIIIKGTPLLINEFLWSTSQATLNQAYSLRGLSTVAATNISSTITNFFNIVIWSMGASIGIIVGRLLGAGKTEEAVDTDRKILAFSVFICILSMVYTIPLGRFFPNIYNTTAEVKEIARKIITIQAIVLPLIAFRNGSYYTLRSGGKTIITMIFDSGMIWTVSVPIAFCLSRFTALSAPMIFFFVQLGETTKALLGYILVKKKVWIQNIVVDKDEDE